MKIDVYGLGFIGTISALNIARAGHSVKVVEVDSAKLNLSAQKMPVFFEKDLDWAEFYQLCDVAARGHEHPDLALVCIGINVSDSGYDLDALKRLIASLKTQLEPRNIIIRSTIAPDDWLEFGENDVGFWPEFLREGSALEDFQEGPHLVAADMASKIFSPNLLNGVKFSHVESRYILSAVKCASNAFRAIKIVFINEIARAMRLGEGDMKIFHSIFTNLRGNADELYLKAGAPFGGYCLPKEVAACAAMLKKNTDCSSENLFDVALRANRALTKEIAQTLYQKCKGELGVYGFNFKLGTSDTRSSVVMEIASFFEGLGGAVIDMDGTSNDAFRRFQPSMIPPEHILIGNSTDINTAHSSSYVWDINSVIFEILR